MINLANPKNAVNKQGCSRLEEETCNKMLKNLAQFNMWNAQECLNLGSPLY